MPERGLETTREAAVGPEAGMLGRLVSVVRLWRERARQRGRLARLPDRALTDIGISRCDAYCEIRKPFWRG